MCLGCWLCSASSRHEKSDLINFTPKVGQILECDYGEYRRDAQGKPLTGDFDSHIPPEMIKNRLVVVLNGKLSRNSCLVVPLSTTHDLQKTIKGIHVEIPEKEIGEMTFFTQQIRWAKADMIQQVSIERLNRPRSKRGHQAVNLTRERVELIQRAVIKAINAASLLEPLVAEVTPEELPGVV